MNKFKTQNPKFTSDKTTDTRVSLFLGVGVSLFVSFLQPLGGHMRVFLRRRQGTVPEQFLYRTQIRAVIQQMRGKTMS